MRAYADKGGKVFTSHWHLEWLAGNTPPWDNAITFYFNGHAPGELRLPDLGSITADLDVSFPKSDALSKWLVNVGASTVRGMIPWTDAKHTAIGFNPTYTERWIHYPGAGARRPSVQYASLTTPLEKPAAEKCGRLASAHPRVRGRSPPPATCCTRLAAAPLTSPRRRRRRRSWRS